jgi:photosystem II stability/assembly factor-like uncharacterized protein
MKTLLQTLFFFLLVTQICFAQWYQQNSGITLNLNSVHFENVTNGWAVGDSGTILRTTNGGENWSTQSSGTIINLNDVTFIDENIGWAVGENGIILKTTNSGVSWTQQTIGPMGPLYGVCFIDANNGWAVGCEYDSLSWCLAMILQTTNGGTTWNSQTSGTTASLSSVSFTDVNTGTAVGSGGTILRTTNGGTTWNLQLSGTYFDLAGVSNIDTNNGFVVGYYSEWPHYYSGEILSTSNGGNDWSILVVFDNYFVLNNVFFTESSNGTVVGKDLLQVQGLILRTTDVGENWITQASGTQNALNRVYFTDNLTGWIVGDGGTILHTTNGGVPVELSAFTASVNGKVVILNWSTATELNNQGFEIERSEDNINFTKIGFVPGFGTTTEPKSYSYSDQSVNSGTNYYRLKQVDYDGSYEYSDVVEIDFRAFNSYLLEQCYPNPFNPTTTIGFGIQSKSNVMIKVLNSIGEEVAVVLNEEKEAGFYQVEFNAIGLPSGVYFYQLKAGSFIETKKMLLLK